MLTHFFGWHRFASHINLFTSTAIAFCVLTMLSGCGSGHPTTTSVSGKVTLAGKPLTAGKIVFYPAQGRPSLAAIGADGTYKLTTFEKSDGALPGQHKVTISAKRLSKNSAAPKNFKDELKMGMGSVGSDVVQWIVPERYSRRATTSLEADVVLGEKNTMNFDIPK